MTDFLFYVFAATILLGALGVVVSRNPVNSAILMIATLLAQAAMFVLLQAYFIAVVQVIIYAGAVMVLFIFIIMLLNIDKVSRKPISRQTAFVAMLCFLALMIGVVYISYGENSIPSPALVDLATQPDFLENNPLPFAAKVQVFGYGLFTKYVLPFEVAGFILLIAMIGVVVISKRYHREEPQELEQEERKVHYYDN
ncbi:MAG: hypothetical protein COZ46_02550 [Verrucomicrobia bacterium CG_4_10_14_3_um_filter_43_23]|nr:MAG: hypothetical protein COX01_00600 [Verrucomicrobia bacterium CG22_combo_CG10-13_8_21_14_all_43_17]PIX58661.1 MAG: hypothetical protein COZ46_02550 [Verrucomicrobia bacterium CG_4_10_14_3_um_filter_43_23]PIY62018.1 MAG: hypothetical protein COY94_03225 [Verrucomicrobia bacterium CG_4_10_14_0_8_um_filter_43_34]PJA43317.1 MAG: hypothetical protein CO175_08845 [Verrucomicrobia bacterium CG_4_9_14_3_um_filter_43_20]